MSAHPLKLRTRSLLAVLWTVSVAGAQCKDPSLPALGFAMTEQKDQLVTFKDGTKTKIDVRFPANVSPSSCGWPVIVLVHGLSGSRRDEATDCRRYASLGYLTASYDVRGQTDWKALNPTAPGCSFVGKEERLDLAEIIAWIGTTYTSAPKADLARVGVGGPSQGGLHAWAAAAWSGKTLPANARSLTTFPTIKVACPMIFPAMHENVFVPGGSTFLNNLVLILNYSGSVNYDPAFQNVLQGLINAENFAGVASFFSSDPWRQDRAQLATSTVPVCTTVGWTDTWADVQTTLDAFAAMPASTPRALLLDASIGHGEFPNDRQGSIQRQREERWLARFLKGEQNGIDAEAKVATSLPITDSLYDNDPTVLLWNRSYDAWPPANNLSTRYWLRAGNVLAPTAPTGSEPADGPVVNTVASGYGIAAYIAQSAPLKVPQVLAAAQPPLAHSSVAYDMAALTDDLEVAGRPQVTLEVTTTDRTLLLHCVLFDVPPGGSERYVTAGTLALRGAASQVQQAQVTLNPIQMRFAKGHKLRLRVENLPWRRAGVDDFEVVPCLTNFSVMVEHGAARQSFLDLPVRGSVMPAISSALPTNVLLSAPQDLRLVIQAPASFLGSTTLTFWTTSGTAPAFMLLGSDPLRFMPDPLTTTLATAAPPLLYGQGDTIKANGEAYSMFGISALAPLSPSLAGLRLSTAALVVAHGFAYPTNSIDFILR